MGQRRSSPAALVEPIRRPGIWVVLVLLIVAAVPLYLPSGTVRPLVFGLPYWMVISVVATVLFAAFTSWVCLRRWNLAEPEEERRAEEGSTWTT